MDMETKIMVEVQMQLMFNMFQACTDNVIDKKHSQKGFTANEAKSIANCFTKYLKTPEIVMGALDNMQNQFWSFKLRFAIIKRFLSSQNAFFV